MSGFEVIGVILGLYPVIGTALEVYKLTRGGKGAKKLARDITVEELIFREFVHHLLAPNVSETELVRLKDPNSVNATSWRDAAANVRNRLGLEKATVILDILDEICSFLRILQDELSPSNHGGTSNHVVDRLRKFHASIRDVKHCLPQSSVKKVLDQLTANNHTLQRLFTDRSLPSNTTSRKQAIKSRRYLRRDSSHVVDLYNAICSGYRCKCDAPHLANFGLPQIPDVPHTDSKTSTEDRQFELLFPLEQSQVQPIGNIRRISICERDSHRTDNEQHRPTIDLCIFLKTLDQHHHVSNTQLGILKLEDKMYELQTAQKSPQNIVCLDNLLTHQNFSLSRRERITIALRLSYAILQFYSTPWIEACWTWGDFCMDKHNDSELFITRKFYSTCSGTEPCHSSSDPNSDFWAVQGEPILTRLGYALIELALGKRLAQLRSENESNSKDPDLLDFLTAKRLVKSGCIEREESRGYENVVKACLFRQFLCTSDLKAIDPSLKSFHEDVEWCIIAPLHKMWTTSWGDS